VDQHPAAFVASAGEEVDLRTRRDRIPIKAPLKSERRPALKRWLNKPAVSDGGLLGISLP